METNKKVTIQLVSPVTVILFILFFLAKIFDKIDWSWWWVFSPLWIPASILIGIIGICLLLIGIAKTIDLCLR
jgi:hypothetical protein